MGVYPGGGGSSKIFMVVGHMLVEIFPLATYFLMLHIQAIRYF